jgi:restriction endonuclease
LDEINSKIVMLSDSLCEEKINDIEKLKARTEKRLKDTKLSLMEKKNISEEEIKLLEPIREQVEHLWSGGLSKASLMYSVEELSAILNEIHRCFETVSIL